MNTKQSVVTVDCHYIKPERAAAYLVMGDSEAAIVDNNTSKAADLLLQEVVRNDLTPEKVKYLIITHVHLDHAGGTATLLKACPNAMVLAHPRAVKHLIDPTRLVQSAKQVYGEELFTRLYGVIEGIPAERVRAVEDGETFTLGSGTLQSLHTAGHARHHITIYHDESETVFTGDTFGVSHPRLQRGTKPFVLCSTAPTEFEADKARESVQRILGTGAKRCALTHFGIIENLSAAAGVLEESITAMEKILQNAVHQPLENEALKEWCEAEIWEVVRDALKDCGLTADENDEDWLGGDIRINSAGLAYCASRLRNA